MNWEILFTHQYKGIKGQQGFGVLNTAHESSQQLMVFQNPVPLMALTLLEDTVALPFLEAVQQIRPCLWVYVHPNTSPTKFKQTYRKSLPYRDDVGYFFGIDVPTPVAHWPTLFGPSRHGLVVASCVQLPTSWSSLPTSSRWRVQLHETSESMWRHVEGTSSSTACPSLAMVGAHRQKMNRDADIS